MTAVLLGIPQDNRQRQTLHRKRTGKAGKDFSSKTAGLGQERLLVTLQQRKDHGEPFCGIFWKQYATKHPGFKDLAPEVL